MTDYFTAQNIAIAAGLIVILAGSWSFIWSWAKRLAADIAAHNWLGLINDLVECIEKIAAGEIGPDEAKAWMAERTAGTAKATILQGILKVLGFFRKSQQPPPPAPGAGLVEGGRDRE